MKKPVTKHSTSEKWKLYVVSISLQLWAYLISLFTGREITHGFYYSDNQKEIFPEMLPQRYITTFRGDEYTEMRGLEHGWSNWNDGKLVGLGSNKDIRFGNQS